MPLKVSKRRSESYSELFGVQASASLAGAGPIFDIGVHCIDTLRFILQDDATQEVVEVIGPDLALNVGNRVEVSGTAATTRPAVSIATSALIVTSVAPRSQGGCLSVAAALDARADTAAVTAPPPPLHPRSRFAGKSP